MKMPFAALLLLSAIPSFAVAQQPVVSRVDRQSPAAAPTVNIPSSSLNTPQITSEMWMYLHEEKRADDPAQAVRRKAEYKAEQRLVRVNSAKWYGYSNSRPEVSSIPFLGDYSAGWSGNGFSRYQWIAAGTPRVSYGIVR